MLPHILMLLAVSCPRWILLVGGGSLPQVTPGQIESGSGLGGGHFASNVNNITSKVGDFPAEDSETIPSTEPPPESRFNVALIEYILFSGTEATVVHGGGSTLSLASGSMFEIVGNSPSIDGHHIVLAVDSRTQFRFSTKVSSGKRPGGKVLVQVKTALTSGSEMDTLHPDKDDECPAGYYCNNDTVLKCGGPRFYCPRGSDRPQVVFEGEPNGGASQAPYAFYTVGGKGSTTRVSQMICPVGSYCVGGERFECPAGTYGERLGENKPSCTGPCSKSCRL